MTASGARARVRAELTREIAEVARRHLASEGAAALSLRAVAREMGMASSAVYRYFPSRDELLTALIVDAYNALGEAAESADARILHDDLFGRWQATCGAVRTWALAHPHEYSLVYGSPVPGYTAPEATIGPAGRVGVVLSGIVADGVKSGAIDGATDETGLDASIRPGLAAELGLPADPSGSLAARSVHAWASLFGMINFELFGQTHNVVVDDEAFFAASTARLGAQLGLAPETRPA